MYRRPKFLEILLEIRREMALEVDYDVDLFAELKSRVRPTEAPRQSAARWALSARTPRTKKANSRSSARPAHDSQTPF